MLPFDLERFGPQYWLADATEPMQHPVFLALAILLGLALVGAVYVRIAADQMFGGHRFKQRQAARLANVVLGFSAAGLILLLFRWLPVPFLSKRVWLGLWFLSALGTAAYVVNYYRTVYPERLQSYLDGERRRRYLPRPGATVRIRRRGRRRR